MLLDKQLMFSDAQVVTVTAVSTHVIDVGLTKDVGIPDGELLIFAKVDGVAVTAVGAATVTVTLETDDNVAFSTPTVLFTTIAIPKATLVAGYFLVAKALPRGCEQFLRLNYTVATGPLTAGTVTAGIVGAIDFYKTFPDALSYSP